MFSLICFLCQEPAYCKLSYFEILKICDFVNSLKKKGQEKKRNGCRGGGGHKKIRCPVTVFIHCRETKSVVAIKLPKVCLRHQLHASFRGSHFVGKQVNYFRSFMLHNGQL